VETLFTLATVIQVNQELPQVSLVNTQPLTNLRHLQEHPRMVQYKQEQLLRHPSISQLKALPTRARVFQDHLLPAMCLAALTLQPPVDQAPLIRPRLPLADQAINYRTKLLPPETHILQAKV
jgi:hypothetical protein